jgi:hypothetical protein
MWNTDQMIFRWENPKNSERDLQQRHSIRPDWTQGSVVKRRYLALYVKDMVRNQNFTFNKQDLAYNFHEQCKIIII